MARARVGESICYRAGGGGSRARGGGNAINGLTARAGCRECHGALPDTARAERSLWRKRSKREGCREERYFPLFARGVLLLGFALLLRCRRGSFIFRSVSARAGFRERERRDAALRVSVERWRRGGNC